MKLEAFRFRNLGPFGEAGVAVSGLRDGLNVVAEANERGKSSLLAGLELLLFKPHTSADRHVKALTHSSDGAAPEGEIDFQHDGRAFRLVKRFRSNRTAELHDLAAGRVVARKGEAEERLAEMLGSRSSRGPSGLLWVRQGTSMDNIRDDGQVAARLEGELGTLVGGDRARAVLAATTASLSELLTQGGRPRTHGPLHTALGALEAARQDLATARAAARDMRAAGEDLARVRERLAQMEAAPDDPDAALAEARQELARADKAQVSLRAAEAEAQRAAATAAAARDKLEAHLAGCAERDHLKTEADRLVAAITSLRKERDTAAEALAAARDDVLALQDAQTAQNARDDARRLRERISERNAALNALTEGMDAAQSAHGRLEALREALSDTPRVTADTLRELLALERELDAADTRLAQIDVTLHLTLEPGQGAELDGAAQAAGTVRLGADSVLRLPGAGTVALDMPEAETLRAERDAARLRRDAAYERLELPDYAAAADAERRHGELAANMSLLERELALLAPDGLDAMEERGAALRADIETLAARLDALGIDADTDARDDKGDVVAQLAAANGRRDAAQERVSETERDLARRDEALRAVRRMLAALPDTTKRDERDTVRARLAAASAAADARAESAQAALDAQRARSPVDPAMARARVERLLAFSKNRKAERETLLTREAALDAQRREALERRDPDAEVRRLEGVVERLDDEVARHQRRADALTLLRDTLQSSQRELREAYTAPVRRELLPLLHQVIDGADLAVGEDLGATALLRGDATDVLEQLSGGTREQIAVLTRLAFARLLAKGGQPTPVILDDALVYADDGRRGRMFDVLNYVTQGPDGLQLLYLSCHAEASAPLGGHRLELTDWPRAEG